MLTATASCPGARVDESGGCCRMAIQFARRCRAAQAPKVRDKGAVERNAAVATRTARTCRARTYNYGDSRRISTIAHHGFGFDWPDVKETAAGTRQCSRIRVAARAASNSIDSVRPPASPPAIPPPNSCGRPSAGHGTATRGRAADSRRRLERRLHRLDAQRPPRLRADQRARSEPATLAGSSPASSSACKNPRDTASQKKDDESVKSEGLGREPVGERGFGRRAIASTR